MQDFPRVSKEPFFDNLTQRAVWQCPKCQRCIDPLSAWVHKCPKKKPSGGLKGWHLVTHSGCMDGATSAILFMKCGGLPEDVHFVPAGQVERWVEDGGYKWVRDGSVPLVFVDVTPSTPAFVDELVFRGNCTIIDHHKTTQHLIDAKNENFHIDVKNEACGCEHFRRWLLDAGFTDLDDTGVIRFCEFIDDHDRWQHNHRFSMQLAKFFAFVGQQRFIDHFKYELSRFREANTYGYWKSDELMLIKEIERHQREQFDSLMKKFQRRKVDVDGESYEFAVLISDEINTSELLNEYLQNNPEVHAACQIAFGLQKVSYRSVGDRFDVSEYAKRMGGGGHKNAAGSPLVPGLIETVINTVVDYPTTRAKNT